jgi:ABC-2 type transport system ATP-binding protein
VRRVIGLAGQNAAVDDTLTGRENLEMIGRLSRLSKAEARERAQEVLERVSLTDAADRQLKTYSGGMRRRIDLGAGLLSHPRVLLLDEPTTGLDPANRLDLWAYLRDLVEEGASILLTTQYLEEADQLASQIVVVDHGQVIESGTPLELKRRLAGDLLDVTVADHDALEKAARALEGAGDGPPTLDRATNRLSLPAHDGATTLVEAVRRLDDAGVRLVDLALRRPSLDDVFLTLTGHVASANGQEHETEEVA